MAISEKLQSLVAEMPDPSGVGMLTDNIDKEKTDRAVAAIFQGGRENFLGLIEMLGEPGTEENVKPHYALHCVLNRALIVNDDSAQRTFCEVLAANLNGDLSTDNKAFLCQELQWAGGKESIEALGTLLLDEDLVEQATMTLIAIGGSNACGQFDKALPEAKGKCRLNVIHGLAALAHCQNLSVFREALGDTDPEVRIVAGVGIAKTAPVGPVPAAIDELIKAADGSSGWERIQQTKNCLILAEGLLENGKKDEAAKIYKHLRATRTDPSEEYIRDIAEKALAAA